MARPYPATLPAFTPVPRTTLRGFTPERQRRFIAALAATGSVMSAAAEVNMSRGAAYLLRTAPGAEEFAAAWDAAIDQGIRALKSVAFDRAIHGEATTIFHNGVPVGEARVHSTQLLMRLLCHYDPQRREGGGEDGGTMAPGPAVAARLSAAAKPMQQRSDAERRLMRQWAAVTYYQALHAEAGFAARVRQWQAMGPDAVEAHLRRIETRARDNALLQTALNPESGRRLAAVTAGLSWLSNRLTAETVEALDAAGLLPDNEPAAAG
jgi:hypothetical protein